LLIRIKAKHRTLLLRGQAQIAQLDVFNGERQWPFL
jgi:hypothetical protein